VTPEGSRDSWRRPDGCCSAPPVPTRSGRAAALTPDGRPIVGPIPTCAGLWYATGHGRTAFCWLVHRRDHRKPRGHRESEIEIASSRPGAIYFLGCSAVVGSVTRHLTVMAPIRPSVSDGESPSMNGRAVVVVCPRCSRGISHPFDDRLERSRPWLRARVRTGRHDQQVALIRWRSSSNSTAGTRPTTALPFIEAIRRPTPSLMAAITVKCRVTEPTTAEHPRK